MFLETSLLYLIYFFIGSKIARTDVLLTHDFIPTFRPMTIPNPTPDTYLLWD